METDNYYIENLETGKLNIYTDKSFYDALPEESKKVFKDHCLWSGKQQCWISKAKSGNAWYLKGQLKSMGFEFRGPVGQRPSTEQQFQTQQKKATARAERFEKRSEQAEQRSDQLYNEAKKMSSAIPMGQPILIGHHSERRDRNYREKIHKKFGKAFEEADKAKHYAERAQTARHTAGQKKLTDPRYLQNRIKECESSIRVLKRRLEGKLYRDSPKREISDEEKKVYNGRLDEENEKLAFFTKHMMAIDPEYLTRKTNKREKGKSL